MSVTNVINIAINNANVNVTNITNKTTIAVSTCSHICNGGD